MRIFIGLDLGTSSIKALALAESGQIVAVSGAGYPTAVPLAGWAEQRIGDWIAAAHQALRELVAGLPAGAEPVALALTGQLPTLALLDARGAALRPAIVWYDGRAEEQAATLLRGHDARAWYARSGIVLDAHYLAPMYAWIAQHQAELLAGEHRLVSAKDALLQALTGQWYTDPSTASGYGVYALLSGNWDAELCAAAGIDPAILPHVADPTAVAGALTAAWTDTGLPLALPVVLGAGDALAGVLGCGGAVPGTLAVIGGTSTSMVVSVPRPRLDPATRFLLTPHALHELWGLEMDLMATGSAIRWLSTMLGLPDPAALPALAAGAPPGAHGLLALPYLAGGEQGAIWDATAPAAFVGLSLRHERADLARALLEGIAFEMRRCLLAWREQGVEIDEIVLTGSQGDETFAHLVAAILGLPVRVAPPIPASALGAALLAGVGVGSWSTAKVQAIARASLGEPLLGAADETARYQALYERYVRVSDVMRLQVGPYLSGG